MLQCFKGRRAMFQCVALCYSLVSAEIVLFGREVSMSQCFNVYASSYSQRSFNVAMFQAKHGCFKAAMRSFTRRRSGNVSMSEKLPDEQCFNVSWL